MHVLLTSSQVDAAVGPGLGTYRDQVFVLGKPVDRIQKQVAVTLKSENTVGCKIGITDDNHARFLIADCLAGRNSE